MATSTRKGRNLKQFPHKESPSDASGETATATIDPPSDPQTPFDAPPPAQEPPPRKTPKTLTFFQRVASIDRAEWGDRAKIKVYRLAPLINRLVGSEHKFVTIYGEPITEEKLKIDHGSGRYRLYLNYKNASEKNEKELDMVELDILDPMFPPKIPPGEWLDDPRNKQWAWARPANAGPQNGQQQQQSVVDPLAAFSTFMDIQDRIEDRVKPVETPSQPTPVDPWSAAEKILNMRSENPMVAILQQQMKDAAAAAEAERDRAFKAAESAREREFKLQEKLLEARTAAPAVPPEKPKTLMEQLADFKALKEIFTNGSGNGGEAIRVGRTTGLDVIKEVTGKFLESDLANGVGAWIGSLATRNANGNGAPIMSNPAPNGTHQQPAGDSLQNFIRDVLNPALLSHYMRGLSGSDFAAWLADGYPARLPELQNFTHPAIPGKRGADAIVTAYKNTPTMWPALSSQGEPRFVEFVNEFCAWKPEADEDVLDVEARTVDHEEGEEGPERI